MRTIHPQPGYVETDTEQLLQSRQFVYADCYTVELITGEIMRWTVAQQDVVVFPIDTDVQMRSYEADGVLVQGLRFKLGIGVEVDEQTITMAYKDTDVVPGRETPVAEALRRGDFDGAIIKRDRFFASNWRQPWVGGIRLFAGRVGSLEGVGRTEGQMKVRSDLVLLNMPMPRNMYGASCQHTVFDSGCKLIKADYVRQLTLLAGSTPTRLRVNTAGIAPSLSLGTVYIESLASLTFSRMIREMTPTHLILSYPLPFIPATGTQIAAYPGCPRTLDVCDQYGNRENFKGFPFVPTAETAY